MSPMLLVASIQYGFSVLFRSLVTPWLVGDFFIVSQSLTQSVPILVYHYTIDKLKIQMHREKVVEIPV